MIRKFARYNLIIKLKGVCKMKDDGKVVIIGTRDKSFQEVADKCIKL